MKIAIHQSKGSFSESWIDHCEQNDIPFKIVNCYDSDIIAQLNGCDALMWHHSHGDYKDVLFAKQLLFSLEHAGIKVFPNFTTAWHFDDKVGQKYLLEAIGAPFVPTYVFYDRMSAVEWASNTSYPKVFKLRGGAGSANVCLVKSKEEALRKIKTAFEKGFSQFDRYGNLKERYNKLMAGNDTLLGLVKALGRLVIPTEFAKMHGREKGYVYFQEFIPDNSFDIRVIVVGDKAFAIKRMTRKRDFRASGSGNIIYDNYQIDSRCIKVAFDLNEKIRSQSIAYDFVFDENNNPLIIELSYGFVEKGYDSCPGYWTSDLQWHGGFFNPQGWMVDELINSLYGI
jgi:glutathione synthase/RimK-type ligase-like ATP-grasp enzyme